MDSVTAFCLSSYLSIISLKYRSPSSSSFDNQYYFCFRTILPPLIIFLLLPFLQLHTFRKMSRRQTRQHNPAPYTQTMNTLRKPDLLRLSREFRLPTDGPVPTLKHRLKGYLNLHRDVLYRDQRYTALFPRHRRAGEPSNSPSPPAPLDSSPSMSYLSLSPDHSFGSWHGIEEPPHSPILHHQQLPPEVPVAVGPAQPDEPYYPPPPPSIPPSVPGSPPPIDHLGAERKFFITSFSFLHVFSRRHLSPFFLRTVRHSRVFFLTYLAETLCSLI